MEQSFKGLLISAALISMFVAGILNFLILFPVEQGFEFSSIDNNTYLTLSSINLPNLTDSSSSLETGFEEWDIEVGFMGSNTQKASKANTNSYLSNVFTALKTISNEVFTTSDGSLHPIIIILLSFSTLVGMYVTIIFIKFLRTGD